MVKKRTPIKINKGDKAEKPKVEETPAVQPEGDAAYEALLAEYASVHLTSKQIDQLIAGLKRDMEQRLKDDGKVKWSGTKGSITYVESQSAEYDMDALRAAVPTSVFRKITDVALNVKAFEAAVANGDIEPEVLRSVVKYKPRKPYVKVTVN